jgi:hypothetical protein
MNHWPRISVDMGLGYRATRLRTAVLCTLLTAGLAPSAQAGMTVYSLRDIYRLRLQEISFFLVMLLGCAFLLKLLWNHAFKAMPSVPRLGFMQASCLALLLGLTMLLLLTIISGIREVLTPGAWRHQGTSYRLNDQAQEPARRRGLEQLRSALFDYARAHGGKFPANDFVPEITDKLWEAPDQLGSHYVYSGGLTTNHPGALLAIEPVNFGDRRFGLTVSGEIHLFSQTEIDAKRSTSAARP